MIKNLKWLDDGSIYAKALEISARKGRCDLIDILSKHIKGLSNGPPHLK
jgi:hypothetical protein